MTTQLWGAITVRRSSTFPVPELDLHRYELRVNGNAIRLEKIPMELLIFLVENRDRLVSREAIVERLWGKNVYLDTEQGINTAVRKIRHALGDDSELTRFLQTVVGKGYRFIGPVTLVGKRDERTRETAAVLVQAPEEVAAPGIRRSWAIPALVTGLLILAAVLTGMKLAGLRRDGSPPNPGIRSIAVLPFENLSGDSGQDYFADGVTDELITMLAKNSGLQIISRTSVMRYKKVQRPLPDIARELGVDGILEGSAGRFGTRVHINVQLIHAPTDTHVWAESYDRDASDIISLQAELAQSIARQVGIAASASSHPPRRINPEAHDAYLMGRYYWFTNDYEKSREYFQKAISLQEDYAVAWSGVADSYIAAAVGGGSPATKAVANGEPAAQKALALDDSVAETHLTMAAVDYFLRWDWPGADSESQRAIEINPRLAEARHLRAYILQTLNRTDEALQQEKEGMRLDPFVRPDAMAMALIHARKFDAAINEARLRSEAQPNNAQLHDMLRSAYMHKGMEKEAAEQWEAELQLSGDKEGALAVHKAFTQGGLKAVHEWELSGLKKQARKGYVAQLDFAAVYAHLRRKEEALHYLELAYQEREPWLVQLQNMPSFDFLHSEPRYQVIVKKMGLPGGAVK
jgi:TolB-like protein/DNA-binding winged helix-turn-helix (wHTH) protein